MRLGTRAQTLDVPKRHKPLRWQISINVESPPYQKSHQRVRSNALSVIQSLLQTLEVRGSMSPNRKLRALAKRMFKKARLWRFAAIYMFGKGL